MPLPQLLLREFYFVFFVLLGFLLFGYDNIRYYIHDTMRVVRVSPFSGREILRMAFLLDI